MPPYVAFQGNSTSIGGDNTAQQQKVPLGLKLDATRPPVNLDEPNGSIQLRFHNGERVVLHVNCNMSVQALYDYVRSVAPVDEVFNLVTGFPPQPCIDLDKTVEECGLIGSAVTQRLN